MVGSTDRQDGDRRASRRCASRWGFLAAGRRLRPAAAGVIAALVYISIPWLTSTYIIPNVNVTSSGLIEGVSACYLFLYVVCPAAVAGGRRKNFARFTAPQQTHPGRPWLALAGYLAGAAVATKYPAVLFVLDPDGRLERASAARGETKRKEDCRGER